MSAHRLLQTLPRYSSTLARYQARKLLAPQPQQQPCHQSVALISTSKKNRDTTITADQVESKVPVTPKTVEDFANPPKKNYQLYGFETDPDWDINIRNYLMFFSVTLGTVVAGFIMSYFPDVRFKNWTQREAYIELARREALGLPLIDPNLVPPENVYLPSDEELGDFEVII